MAAREPIMPMKRRGGNLKPVLMPSHDSAPDMASFPDRSGTVRGGMAKQLPISRRVKGRSLGSKR